MARKKNIRREKVYSKEENIAINLLYYYFVFIYFAQVAWVSKELDERKGETVRGGRTRKDEERDFEFLFFLPSYVKAKHKSYWKLFFFLLRRFFFPSYFFPSFHPMNLICVLNKLSKVYKNKLNEYFHFSIYRYTKANWAFGQEK